MKAMLKGLRMKPLAVKVGELGMYLSLKTCTVFFALVSFNGPASLFDLYAGV